MNVNHDFKQAKHEPGTILLLCTSCDMERDTPIAHCPACEERTVSYEYVVGFDYAAAHFNAGLLDIAATIAPRNLVAPLLSTEPMPNTAQAWSNIA